MIGWWNKMSSLLSESLILNEFHYDGRLPSRSYPKAKGLRIRSRVKWWGPKDSPLRSRYTDPNSVVYGGKVHYLWVCPVRPHVPVDPWIGWKRVSFGFDNERERRVGRRETWVLGLISRDGLRHFEVFGRMEKDDTGIQQRGRVIWGPPLSIFPWVGSVRPTDDTVRSNWTRSETRLSLVYVQERFGTEKNDYFIRSITIDDTPPQHS